MGVYGEGKPSPSEACLYSLGGWWSLFAHSNTPSAASDAPSAHSDLDLHILVGMLGALVRSNFKICFLLRQGA